MTQSAKERILEAERIEATRSFAKLEGFMDAAIDELFPSYTANGKIEAVLITHIPRDGAYNRDVRMIKDALYDIRTTLRDLKESLRDIEADFHGVMQEYGLEDERCQKFSMTKSFLKS